MRRSRGGATGAWTGGREWCWRCSACALRTRRGSGFGSEKVVYGQRVNLAAVGAAVFDFGDSHGLVAAVSEPNAFYILVRYEEQSIRKALCNLHMADPRSRSNLVQYRACAIHSP